jgi:hypothetical protein
MVRYTDVLFSSDPFGFTLVVRSGRRRWGHGRHGRRRHVASGRMIKRHSSRILILRRRRAPGCRFSNHIPHRTTHGTFHLFAPTIMAKNITTAQTVLNIALSVLAMSNVLPESFHICAMWCHFTMVWIVWTTGGVTEKQQPLLFVSNLLMFRVILRRWTIRSRAIMRSHARARLETLRLASVISSISAEGRTGSGGRI